MVLLSLDFCPSPLSVFFSWLSSLNEGITVRGVCVCECAVWSKAAQNIHPLLILRPENLLLWRVSDAGGGPGRSLRWRSCSHNQQGARLVLVHPEMTGWRKNMQVSLQFPRTLTDLEPNVFTFPVFSIENIRNISSRRVPPAADVYRNPSCVLILDCRGFQCTATP